MSTVEPADTGLVGRQVDIGGYRLQLREQGDGVPAVVFEGGTWEFGLTWALVQPRVAEFARAVAYDRAGLGWSDPSPAPRSPDRMAGELQALLEAAAIAPPYVLVGQSFGGLVVRRFAARHPDMVAGLVLVDAAHEQQLLRFPEAIRRIQPTLHAIRRQQLEMLRNQIVTGAVDPATIPVHAALPEQTAAEWRTATISGAKVVDAMLAELDAVEQSHAEMRGAGDGRLGSIPLVVLSHGQPIAAFPPQLGVTEQDATAYERTWQELQGELAALSTRGRRIIAEQSDHMIHHDQPDLVVNAIRDVMEQAPTVTARTDSIRRSEGTSR